RRRRGNLDNYRRSIRVRIGIDRSRIPIPCGIHHSPPTDPTPLPSVNTAADPPNDDIVLMKMFDTAVPKRSWSRLTKGGQCDSHQYSRQQRQKDQKSVV